MTCIVMVFENLSLMLESWNKPMVSQSHIIMKDLLICLRLEIQLSIWVGESTYYNIMQLPDILLFIKIKSDYFLLCYEIAESLISQFVVMYNDYS